MSAEEKPQAKNTNQPDNGTPETPDQPPVCMTENPDQPAVKKQEHSDKPEPLETIIST